MSDSGPSNASSRNCQGQGRSNEDLLVFIAADGERLSHLYKTWVWFKVMDPPKNRPSDLVIERQIHANPPKSMGFGWHPVASRSHYFEAQPNVLLQKIWKFCWTFQEPLNDCSSSFTVTSQPMWGPKKGAKHAWTTATQEEKESGHCNEIVPEGPECLFQSALGHASASSC